VGKRKRKIEFEIQEDAIVFKAVWLGVSAFGPGWGWRAGDGVPTIPDWMDEKANEVAAKHGREVVDVEGNFEEVRFCVDRAFTLKELDDDGNQR